MQYFVIRDRKGNSSNKAWPSANRGTAIRDVAELLKAEERLRDYASDYTVRYVGDLDVVTDVWDLTDAPADVIEVVELVE